MVEITPFQDQQRLELTAQVQELLKRRTQRDRKEKVLSSRIRMSRLLLQKLEKELMIKRLRDLQNRSKKREERAATLHEGIQKIKLVIRRKNKNYVAALEDCKALSEKHVSKEKRLDKLELMTVDIEKKLQYVKDVRAGKIVGAGHTLAAAAAPAPAPGAPKSPVVSPVPQYAASAAPTQLDAGQPLAAAPVLADVGADPSAPGSVSPDPAAASAPNESTAPATGPTFPGAATAGPAVPLRTGYLSKLGGFFLSPKFQRRFFILTSNDLRWYEQEVAPHNIEQTQAKNYLNISQVQRVEMTSKGSAQYAFKLTGAFLSKPYTLCASTSNERDDWVASLKSAAGI